MHGAEIYAVHLNDDIDFVVEVEDNKMSPHFFTLSFTYEALKNSFPNHYEEIFCDLLEMLTFDAITGNNDRHFYNWGVITDIQNKKEPRFAPIYDTARALFWNFSDEKVENVMVNEEVLQKQIKKQGENSKPKMGIENRNNPNHFRFIEEIYSLFSDYSHCVTNVIKKAMEVDESKLFNKKYRYLLSANRRKLILDCLNYRKDKLSDIADKYD